MTGEWVTFIADVSHQLLAICIQQNRMQMTQCKVIHVPVAGAPFALAMHLKCNQRKPKPKQTLLPYRQPASQPVGAKVPGSLTLTLLSNELRCESRSIVRKCRSVDWFEGGWRQWLESCKNAFGKLQNFLLSIGLYWSRLSHFGVLVALIN